MSAEISLNDQEVRIRLLERLVDKIDQRFEHMENKMDSQFKWTIGTLIGLFCGTFMPLLGGVVLHMAKLI